MLSGRRIVNRYRYMSVSPSRPQSVQRSVSIGDVHIPLDIPERPDLVPRGYFDALSCPEVLEHIRWIAQKRIMKQDIFLLGLPSSLRRRVVMAAAELCDWEVEYIAITRDTTESDLKQRREIVGNSVVYFNQAPVRAAIHGRLLIIDGIENAERNVLPSLNNLLENREMSLDDGSFLTGKKIDPDSANSTAKLLQVHPNFQVVALGLPVPPFSGRSLDPPLRSRFQCRYVDDLSSESILRVLDTGSLDMKSAENLIRFYEAFLSLRYYAVNEGVSLSGLPVLSADFFAHSLKLKKDFPQLSEVSIVGRMLPVVSDLNQLLPLRFNYTVSEALASLRRHQGVYSSGTNPYALRAVSAQPGERACATATFTVLSKEKQTGSEVVVGIPCGPHMLESVQSVEKHLLSHQFQVLSNMLMDHSCGKHIALLGPKGSGKTIVARSFGTVLGYNVHIFPLYNDLSARDLLQRRSTDKDGNTSQWIDSPLVAAAKAGDICVLDGVERLDLHSLVSLKRFLQDGVVDLPDGHRLSVRGTSAASDDAACDGGIKDSFRVLALSLPPSASSSIDDARQRWVTSDMGFACHFLPSATSADIQCVLKKTFPFSSSVGSMEGIRNDFCQLLNRSLSNLLATADQNQLPEFAPSLRHAVRLQQVLLPSLTEDIADNNRQLRMALDGTFLVKFMSSLAASKFEVVMQTLGLGYSQLHIRSDGASTDSLSGIPVNAASQKIETLKNSYGEKVLRIGNVEAPLRQAKNEEKVPSPLFHENSLQTLLLSNMLRTYASGVKSMLLIGNQGVGKNKLVDRLLQLLNAEREYVQLHRDTTVQSLTVLPNLVNGKIYYDDSPLVRAAKEGSVLVIDEADKAPVEVVCLLKMLIEDGELLLQDGRRLLTAERKGTLLSSHLSESIVEIHPDFRLIALANRPGFPFHGNNFFRECGDVLTTHVIDNLDLNSEVELLRAYGPDVPVETLSKLSLCFQDLRIAHAVGRLAYPFSAREAVAVVKHLQAFPRDGIAAATEDFLGFEGATPKVRRALAEIFRARGVPIPLEAPSSGSALKNIMLNSTRLAPTQIINPPVEKKLSVSKFSPLPHDWSVEVHEKKKRNWNISEVVQGDYSVHSTRLNIFSEQIGQIFVGGNDQSQFSGYVLDMVTDNAGTLHILSDQPLELHSYYDVAKAVALGGTVEQKYVKRTLISAEGAWRMGCTKALLVPGVSSAETECSSTESGGGVVVVLPDLAVALTIGVDVSSGVSAISLPKDMVGAVKTGPKASRRSGFMGRIFNNNDVKQSENFNTTYSTKNGGKSAVMWSKGGSDIFVFNVEDGFIKLVHLDDEKSLISVQFLRIAADRSEEFVLSFEGISSQTIIRVAPNSTERGRGNNISDFSISMLQASDADNSSLFNILTADRNGNHHDRATDDSSFGGRAASFADRLNMSKGTMQTWKRDGNNYKDQSFDVILSAASQSATYNILSSPSQQEKLVLEVVELEPALRRGISLQPASGNGVDDGSQTHISALCLLQPFATPNCAPCAGDAHEVVCLAYRNGCVKFFDSNHDRLHRDLASWQSMFPNGTGDLSVKKNGGLGRDVDQRGKPKTGLNLPKHGKEDSKNEPHIGGNTWAGGTGGSDTAGLGGRGGPYRLDKGHTVHQVSDEDKAAVSAEAKKMAAEIAKAALKQRLEDISMGKDEYDIYNRFHGRIENQLVQLKTIIEEFSLRSKERVWLRNQSSGELDDAKIIDGLSGEKLVFKRRGIANDSQVDNANSNNPDSIQKRIEVVMDVSGSMYRFNGTDRRLERMLETALMIMAAMPSSNSESSESSNILQYCLSGHSGDTDYISFVTPDKIPQNESERFMVLQSMIAHTQYCMSGDHTLEAIEAAVARVVDSTKDESVSCQRYVLVVSDANFRRYGISTSLLTQAMTKDPRVQVHLILIAGLGDEAAKTAAALPDGQCHVCDGSSSTDLVGVFKNILTARGGVLDTSSF